MFCFDFIISVLPHASLYVAWFWKMKILPRKSRTGNNLARTQCASPTHYRRRIDDRVLWSLARSHAGPEIIYLTQSAGLFKTKERACSRQLQDASRTRWHSDHGHDNAFVPHVQHDSLTKSQQNNHVSAEKGHRSQRVSSRVSKPVRSAECMRIYSREHCFIACENADHVRACRVAYKINLHSLTLLEFFNERW